MTKLHENPDFLKLPLDDRLVILRFRQDVKRSEELAAERERRAKEWVPTFDPSRSIASGAWDIRILLSQLEHVAYMPVRDVAKAVAPILERLPAHGAGSVALLTKHRSRQERAKWSRIIAYYQFDELTKFISEQRDDHYHAVLSHQDRVTPKDEQIMIHLPTLRAALTLWLAARQHDRELGFLRFLVGKPTALTHPKVLPLLDTDEELKHG